jgi:hypothetical protein
VDGVTFECVRVLAGNSRAFNIGKKFPRSETASTLYANLLRRTQAVGAIREISGPLLSFNS